MTDKTDKPDCLEQHLAALATKAPAPSAELMARVLQDALAEQAGLAHNTQRPQPAPGWLRQVFRGLGGWPAMAGLSSSVVVGVWLGLNPPETLATATAEALGLSDAAYLIDVAADATFELAGGDY